MLPSTLVIGQSDFITRFVNLIPRTSRHSNTFLSGPEGVGKTHLARYFHEAGPRAGEELRFWRPPPKGKQGISLVDRQCAVGRAIRELGRGTLVIEDIERLTKGEQNVLLRYFDLGILSDRNPPTEGLEVVVVATTRTHVNREDPGPRFLHGFWYGFMYPLWVPPLWMRPEDLALLAQACARATGGALGRPGLRVTPEGMRFLESQPWPGNVRQLFAVVGRACARAKGGKVDARGLRSSLREPDQAGVS